jgi:uncharacterized membrane protein YbhN (UPF0104 family)
LTKAHKKILSYGIKAIVVSLAAVFIYQKLTANQNLKNFFDIIHQLDQFNAGITIFLIFVLMLLNWFLESLKWRFLIKKIEPISLYKAVESVFCGLTWAVFTPNRIGEYGGRIFFLSPRKRIFGIVAMAVGQISQMMITNVVGAMALLWFSYHFLGLNSWIFLALCFLAMGFSFFFVLFYFNIHWLERLLTNITFLKKYKRFFAVLKRYSKPELNKTFLLSMARFAVFTFQYLLIIHLLIGNIPLFQSTLMLFILYFIQSALPSLDLLDIGVRSLTATYFFAYITNQEIAVMAAIALIWLVNLIIPAIFGTYFVFKLNFFGNNNR